MNPDKIKELFGEEALNMLYDSALQNTVHDLVDWIFESMSVEDIALWIKELREEAAGEDE
jgi:hypothetical protein